MRVCVDVNINTQTMESFLKECLIMKNLSHPHVLQLLGIAFDSFGHPMIVLPYMVKGDLRTYVKNKDLVSECCYCWFSADCHICTLHAIIISMWLVLVYEVVCWQYCQNTEIQHKSYWFYQG